MTAFLTEVLSPWGRWRGEGVGDGVCSGTAQPKLGKWRMQQSEGVWMRRSLLGMLFVTG